MSEQSEELSGRPWGFWPTFGFGVAIFIAYFLTTFLAGIVFVAIRIASQANPDILESLDIFSDSAGLFVSLASIPTTVVGVGLIVLFIVLRSGISITEYLGLKKVSLKAILISLALVAGLIVANDAVCVILGRPVNPQVMVDTYNTSVYPVLFWVAVVIFAPAFEEAFFRGFLFKGFSYSRLGIIGTIVLTSISWALLHQQYEIFELSSIFISGILIGIMRYKTGSLWTPLIMHAFMNVVATLEVALNVNSLFV